MAKWIKVVCEDGRVVRLDMERVPMIVKDATGDVQVYVQGVGGVTFSGPDRLALKQEIDRLAGWGLTDVD